MSDQETHLIGHGKPAATLWRVSAVRNCSSEFKTSAVAAIIILNTCRHQYVIGIAIMCFHASAKL